MIQASSDFILINYYNCFFDDYDFISLVIFEEENLYFLIL